MRKSIFTVAVFALMGTSVFAQENRKSLKAKTTATAANPADVMKFKHEVHDFGQVKDGDKAEYVFEFKNTGKEPIIIQNAYASCGCTVPTWSKEPIKPGKKGEIKVVYNTVNRPGPIDKQVTVQSNVGTKVLRITGNVNAKPVSSVPSNGSVIKH